MGYNSMKSLAWRDLTADTRNQYDFNMDNIVESKIAADNNGKYFNRSYGAEVPTALYVTDRMSVRPHRNAAGQNVLLFRTEGSPYGDDTDLVLERDLLAEAKLPKEAEGLVRGDGVRVSNAYNIRPGAAAGSFDIQHRPLVKPEGDHTEITPENPLYVNRNRGTLNGPFVVRGASFDVEMRFKDFERIEHMHDIRVTDVYKSTFTLPYNRLTHIRAYQVDGDEPGTIQMQIPERRLGVVPDVAGSRSILGYGDGTNMVFRAPHYPIVNETFKLYVGTALQVQTPKVGPAGNYEYNPWTGDVYFNAPPAPGVLVTAAYEYTMGGQGFYLNYATGIIKIAGPVFQVNDYLRVFMRSEMFHRTLSVRALTNG